MTERTATILISAAVSTVIGIIQIIVVTIDARRTAKKIAKEGIERLRHRFEF